MTAVWVAPGIAIADRLTARCQWTSMNNLSDESYDEARKLKSHAISAKHNEKLLFSIICELMKNHGRIPLYEICIKRFRIDFNVSIR